MGGRTNRAGAEGMVTLGRHTALTLPTFGTQSRTQTPYPYAVTRAPAPHPTHCASVVPKVLALEGRRHWGYAP